MQYSLPTQSSKHWHRISAACTVQSTFTQIFTVWVVQSSFTQDIHCQHRSSQRWHMLSTACTVQSTLTQVQSTLTKGICRLHSPANTDTGYPACTVQPTLTQDISAACTVQSTFMHDIHCLCSPVSDTLFCQCCISKLISSQHAAT